LNHNGGINSGGHNSDSDGSVLWDAMDVARHFKISRATVYRKVASGELPHVRVFGTLVRFEPKAMRALVSGKATATR
jgi:excisionase family DNA binding protein